MFMFGRRELLRMGLAAGMTCAAGLPVRPWPAPLGRAGSRSRTCTRARRSTPVYWENGKYVPDAVAALNKVLRDFRTGDVHMIDRASTTSSTPSRPRSRTRKQFQIISGYRSPKTNTMLKKTAAAASPPTACTWKARPWTSASTGWR